MDGGSARFPNNNIDSRTQDGVDSLISLLKRLRVSLFGETKDEENLEIEVQDQSIARILSKKSEYKYTPKKLREIKNIIPGIRPSFPGSRRPKKIPSYEIPLAIRVAFQAYQENQDERQMRELVNIERDRTTYKLKFHNMLYAEELQMEVDIRKYDRVSLMEKRGIYLVLHVQGLAEKRPSLLVGDFVYARAPGDEHHFEGYVHRVEREHVSLCFHDGFHARHIKGTQYEIQYYLLLDLSTENALFPLYYPKMSKPNLHFFNPSLNSKQKQAVEMIIGRKGRDIGAPYVVFGPPGTGKTITVIESILQLRADKSINILACAPSNSAADLIAERLAKTLSTLELLRLNAPYRDAEDLPKSLEKYSCFGLPNEDIATYQVIVTTCVSAQLVELPEGHFSYIFIDEAGHALEPEALIGFSSRLHEKSTLVLAGDPRQLGPIVRSKFSIEGGLEMSLLERLTKFNVLYQKEDEFSAWGKYNPFVLTKLIENYRSHPEILKVPNELFYDGELIPVSQEDFKWVKWVQETVNTKLAIPMLFHGMPGKDDREGNSPSWFNQMEATQVYQYVLKLKAEVKNFRQESIGIITPYRKQVEKLRVLLREKKLQDIKVGSVEEFQGQEREVIIVSTVRSNVRNLDFDYKFNLGFLRNPKRFNVAITRAKSLVIVIGNPFVLQHDPNWRKLLKYCIEKKVYTGCKFEFNANNQMVETFVDTEFDPISQKTKQEDPEWDQRH